MCRGDMQAGSAARSAGQQGPAAREAENTPTDLTADAPATPSAPANPHTAATPSAPHAPATPSAPAHRARPGGRLLARPPRRRLLWLAGLLPAGALCAYLLNPAAQAAGQAASQRGVPFHGAAAVGPLFKVVRGKLTSHFCTASVVHSKAENLLITAAHCVYRNKQPPAGSIAFAPGYHNGKFPHGVWTITAVYVNQAWWLHRDPNNDVAFLIAGRPGDRIERHTGAEALGIHWPPQLVEVIGYPDSTNSPVGCAARARAFRTDPHQMIWDCPGYTSGTSGGPFLAQVNAKGNGTVIGVIGGWEQGGDLPSVSYSPRFFTNVGKLYQQATSGQPPS
jgi:V8-like Glu-specific endopeptidase